MNTGHEGSLSTCHANSPVDALRRIETMVMMGDVGLPLGAIREQLVSAIDLIVHVARLPNGRRAIVGVAEVTSDSQRVRRIADELRVLAAPERSARR